MDLISGTKGKVTWKSPSNIALVKYWGKHGRQLPGNPSISFTLEQAHTITDVSYFVHDSDKDALSVKFSFEGEENPAFADRIITFLESVQADYPFLKHLSLEINSQNSFPHSSGIASSASSMSALALCVVSIERELLQADAIDFQKASNLARLGSGSASRSVYGPVVIWGQSQGIANSSDLHAIPFEGTLNPIFDNFHDDILIISDEKKSVSSTAGHALMDTNPYQESRYKQAHTHISEIIKTLENGDLETFGLIVEKEALTLHALMMASSPPYILMEPNTITAIRDIQTFRKNTNIPVFFTLDAGPNIHLLYPEKYKNEVKPLLEHLSYLCVDEKIISDNISNGPVEL